MTGVDVPVLAGLAVDGIVLEGDGRTVGDGAGAGNRVKTGDTTGHVGAFDIRNR